MSMLEAARDELMIFEPRTIFMSENDGEGLIRWRDQDQ